MAASIVELADDQDVIFLASSGASVPGAAAVIDLTVAAPAVKRPRPCIAAAAPLRGKAAAAGATAADSAAEAVAAAAVGEVDVLAILHCPICFDDYRARPMFATVCGHHAHEACFSAWFARKPVAPAKLCPVCKSATPLVHRMFLSGAPAVPAPPPRK